MGATLAHRVDDEQLLDLLIVPDSNFQSVTTRMTRCSSSTSTRSASTSSRERLEDAWLIQAPKTLAKKLLEP